MLNITKGFIDFQFTLKLQIRNIYFIFGHGSYQGQLITNHIGNALSRKNRFCSIPIFVTFRSNKKIYVNGKPINQKLLSEKDNLRIYEELLNDRAIKIQQIASRINYPEEWEVPKDMYFVVGDNRDNSQDSRVLRSVGYIPEENLVGRAEILFFSTKGTARIWEVWGWPFTIRYGRLGKLL